MMKFGITMASSTTNNGEGPTAILKFSTVEGLGEFREWLHAEVLAGIATPPTRWEIFKMFLRGKIE